MNIFLFTLHILNCNLLFQIYSIVYVKAVENDIRGDDDLADCVGTLSIDRSCPAVDMKFNNLEKLYPDLVIEDHADCTSR